MTSAERLRVQRETLAEAMIMLGSYAVREWSRGLEPTYAGTAAIMNRLQRDMVRRGGVTRATVER